MFFQYEDDLVQSAIQKANDFLENSMLSIEESSRINLYNWWTEEPDDGYCVDQRVGKIILEQLDENYNVIANEIIGDFQNMELLRVYGRIINKSLGCANKDEYSAAEKERLWIIKKKSNGKAE